MSSNTRSQVYQKRKRQQQRQRRTFCGLFLLACVVSLWMILRLSQSIYAEETRLTIRFMSADGTKILAQHDVERGKEITLPAAPRDTSVGSYKVYGTPAWKTAKDITVNGQIFASKQTLSYNTAKNWAQEQEQLTLYATKACKIQYRKADGKALSYRDYVYEGCSYQYHASPNVKNSCYKGWTLTKGSLEMDYKFDAKSEVWESQDLYLITYYQVKFFKQDGTRDSALDKLNKVVAPGSTITMPTAASVSRYKNLGWSTTANAASAAVAEGKQYTVNSNVNFYLVRKYQPYQVKFTSNDGKSTAAAYQRLNQYAYQNQTLTAPEPPAINGYVALGWASKPKKTTADYKIGSRLQIRGNTTYYAVYRKANKYVVDFVMSGGKTDATYQKLTRTVYEGTVLTLPSIPAKKNYMDKGWRVSINGEVFTYKPGAKFKITKKTRFYSWQVPSANLILYNASGKVQKSVVVEKGSTYRLPSLSNPKNYTFLGWDYKPGLWAKHSNPLKITYQAGGLVTVNGTVRLYPVYCDRRSEGSVPLNKLVTMTKAVEATYPELILVGDSRTVRLGQTLNSMNFFGTEAGKHVSIVAKYGQGISWFKSTGYAELKEKIKSIRNKGQNGKIAVVINLGVNDLNYVASYVEFMNKIGPELTDLNCRLFYLSVNPVNSAQMQWARNNGHTKASVKTEASVRGFNREMKAKLNSCYTFLSSYNWLMSCGYSTDKGYNQPSGQNMGVDDGLHYTVNTYKWIYEFILESLQK